MLTSRAKEKKAAEKPDFWENPEGYMRTMQEEMEQQFQDRLTNSMLAFSLETASYRHDDFEEMKQAFTEAAEQNPALAQQAVQAADPGEYVYSTGKQFKQLSDVGGDVDSLKEQLRAEIKAELMAEMKQKEEKIQQVPDALTDETNASAPREKPEGGPTPLDNILGHNNR